MNDYEAENLKALEEISKVKFGGGCGTVWREMEEYEPDPKPEQEEN